MKRSEQIIVCVPDIPGVLSELATILWGNRIQILECSTDITEGLVVIRLDVDNPALAQILLSHLGWDSDSRKRPRPTELLDFSYNLQLDFASQ